MVTGFVPCFEQKIQRLFKDFQGHISHYFQGLNSVQKNNLESMPFLLLQQQEQYYPEGLSVFAELDKVTTKIQGLSSNNCNFHGHLLGLEYLF